MDQYGVGFQINLLDGKVWEILRVETGFYLVSTPVGASPMEATRRWIRQVAAFPFESDQSHGIRYSHRHGEDFYVAGHHEVPAESSEEGEAMPKFTVSYDLRLAGLLEVEALHADAAEAIVAEMSLDELKAGTCDSGWVVEVDGVIDES
jgi:hypothetical protein